MNHCYKVDLISAALQTSRRRHPQAQISAGLVWTSFAISSGLIYASVPIKFADVVNPVVMPSMALARPKSQRSALVASLTKTFS